jgi:UDP-N-acetylglucosamine--N-acetylmuramyl-(pentapeptide) pyrophosphoryl-undecaprenol N-acetylglucosamine transferase
MKRQDSQAKNRLFSAITPLAKDSQLHEKFEENISKYAITNADEVIAREILKDI